MSCVEFQIWISRQMWKQNFWAKNPSQANRVPFRPSASVLNMVFGSLQFNEKAGHYLTLELPWLEVWITPHCKIILGGPPNQRQPVPPITIHSSPVTLSFHPHSFFSWLVVQYNRFQTTSFIWDSEILIPTNLLLAPWAHFGQSSDWFWGSWNILIEE